MFSPLTKIAAQIAYDEATSPTVILQADTQTLGAASTRAHKRPWWRQGGLPVDNPFKSLGDKYCLYCKDMTDHNEEAGCAAGVYVSRQRCNRCGRPSGFAMAKVTLLAPGPMPTIAATWCNERGTDRS